MDVHSLKFKINKIKELKLVVQCYSHREELSTIIINLRKGKK